MGSNPLVAIVGLTFSMISIKLASIVEGAQIVIVDTIGKRPRSIRPRKKVVALAIGARRFLMIKIGIVFFGKISSIIFAVEEMYPAKAVEGATLSIMNTVLLSSRIGKVAAKHGKHVAKKIRSRYSGFKEKRVTRTNG
jgi:hypothetical protein